MPLVRMSAAVLRATASRLKRSVARVAADNGRSSPSPTRPVGRPIAAQRDLRRRVRPRRWRWSRGSVAGGVAASMTPLAAVARGCGRSVAQRSVVGAIVERHARPPSQPCRRRHAQLSRRHRRTTRRSSTAPGDVGRSGRAATAARAVSARFVEPRPCTSSGARSRRPAPAADRPARPRRPAATATRFCGITWRAGVDPARSFTASWTSKRHALPARGRR